MKKLIVLLIVLFLGFDLIAEENSLNEKIKLLLSNLGHPFAFHREEAVVQLSSLNEDIILPHLQKLLSSSSPIVRKEVITILGRLEGKDSTDILLSLLTDSDFDVRIYAAVKLIEKGEEKEKLLEEKLKSPPFKTPPLSIMAQMILNTLLHKKLEEELARLVSPTGNAGFYTGQFDDVIKLGKGIVPILLDMFRERKPGEKEYEYVSPNIPDIKHDGIRVLAGDALGECGHLLGKYRNTTILLLQRMSNSLNESIKDSANTALYRLGIQGFISDRIEYFKGKLEVNPLDMDTRLELANLYLKIRDSKKGQEELEKIRDSGMMVTNPGLVYYNLACVYATQKRINDAIISLEKSVEEGYDDVGWIELDGDLMNIRENPRYKALIEKLRKKRK